MLRIFDRVGQTWSLMGASWNVLRSNKSLMVFPILSGLASLIVIASFIIPAAVTGFWEPPGAEDPASSQVAYYGFLFAFYVCNYFVILFFNSALIACAMVGLQGGRPSVADGLRIAVARIWIILGWALVSATVSIVIRIIEDRSEAVGKIIASLLGTAWTMLTFLALPVMVVEKKGPAAAFKRSASLLKQTWGEQIIGGFSFGMLFFLLALPALLLVFLGIASGSAPLLILLAGVAGVYFLLLMMVQPVLHSIFRSALYLYALNGEAPPAFGHEDLLDRAVESR